MLQLVVSPKLSVYIQAKSIVPCVVLKEFLLGEARQAKAYRTLTSEFALDDLAHQTTIRILSSQGSLSCFHHFAHVFHRGSCR